MTILDFYNEVAEILDITRPDAPVYVVVHQTLDEPPPTALMLGFKESWSKMEVLSVKLEGPPPHVVIRIGSI